MLQKETKSLHCLGGILADDQVIFDIFFFLNQWTWYLFVSVHLNQNLVQTGPWKDNFNDCPHPNAEAVTVKMESR